MASPDIVPADLPANAEIGPTQEWRRLKTMEDAEAIARATRRRPAKMQNSSGRKRTRGMMRYEEA